MYCVSQRAEHIWEGVSSATTRSRPIINTRDEPHADAERYRRLHVIVGDSNMNEYATFLKVGTTAILLRMLEDPSVVLRDLTLDNPIRAIREISHDVTCKRKVKLHNGRELTALEIQAEYMNRAIRYRDAKGLQEAMEGRLAASNVRLISYLEEKGNKAGLSIPSINPKADVVLDGEKIVESAAEFTLTDIPLNRLVDFLAAVEAGPGVVKVKYLRMEPHLKDETLTAWVVVATYHLKN